MEKIKHEIGDMWKDGKTWMVKFPHMAISFKVKKYALAWSKQLKKDNGAGLLMSETQIDSILDTK